MDIEASYQRWCAHATGAEREQLEELAHDQAQLEDAFYRDLAFGTGGLRGIVGPGSNRMNARTVAQATQGLADYANAYYPTHPRVAIARDSRHGGELFVRTAASVLASNGIEVCLYERVEPTPALSFAVRDLSCTAGINITASHNPAAYNGYKVYGSDGCQITTKAAHEIQAAIDAVDVFGGVAIGSYDELRAAGSITFIGEDTLTRYIEAVLKEAAPTATSSALHDLKLVYTPLNGTGLECMQRVMKALGVENMTVVPQQAQPDGDFATCPFPNPERREALELGLDLAERTDADLLIATDPDADRLGLAVPHDGTWQLLSGNEVGILLLDYLCQRALKAGEDLSRRVAITTIVSTPMAEALARHYGFQLRKTLTGFKYIGEQIGLLEAEDGEDRFLFGFEESYGYLSGTQVRDKDALNAAALVCEMACWHQAHGCDLVEVLDGLYRCYGFYCSRLLSIEYPGAQGARHMAELMKSLRDAAPSRVAGHSIERVTDYLHEAAMPVVNQGGDVSQSLPAGDVVQFDVADGARLIIRPSGTEPKTKCYLSVCEATAAAGEHELDAIEEEARALLA